jgi:large subunit ribosomal protein L7/L12
MAKLKKEDILEYLKEATILELNDVVKAIEEEFGISAAAPVAVAAGGGGAAGEAAAEAAPSQVTVSLTGAGDQKIQVIKVVRQITGLGLKEAKEVVDGAPSAIKEDIEPEEAEKIKEQLEEVGASVEIQ